MNAGAGSRDSFVTPSSTSWIRRELDNIQKEIDTKADEKTIEAKLTALAGKIRGAREVAEEAKKIGLSARKQAFMTHECVNEDRFIVDDNRITAVEKRQEESDNKVGRWDSWWKVVMVSVVAGVVIVGSVVAAVWYNGESLSDDVSVLTHRVGSLDASVKEVRESQRDMKRALEVDRESDAVQAEEQLEVVKDAVKAAIIEANRNSSKRRKR